MGFRDFLQKLYQGMPINLQQKAIGFYGYRVQKTRFNKEFDYILAEAEERLGWSCERLTEYRNLRLQHFIMQSATTVPYYRRLFKKEKIDPESIRMLEDLVLLPTLKKQTVIQNPKAFQSSAVSRKEVIQCKTSGSTGAALQFLKTKQADREQWALWWRYFRHHGIQRGEWCALFMTHPVVAFDQEQPPFWRYDKFGKRIIFSAYHLGERYFSHYLEELRRSGVRWVHGRPSMLALLAGYMLDSGDMLDEPMGWVTCSAETLSRHQAKLIEAAFGVCPLQHYGLAEGVANISELTKGALFVDEDFAAVEFDPLEEGGARIIGTNFSNLAMPLIRYDTQDVARVSADTLTDCDAPRMVASIDGRIEDYVVLADGRKVSSVNRIFDNVPNITEAQIQQSRAGEITVNVVPRNDYSEEDEARLRGAIGTYLGRDLKVEIQRVKTLERTAQGKLRAVQSSVPGARS